jgi:shikimate kinase
MILKLKRTPGIYLVGFMGSGKSTVGERLADELGWKFADLDDDIVKTQGRSIVDIFDTGGEAAFREIETDCIRKRVRNVQSGHPMVLAMGGGAFAQENNYKLLQENGVTIWLDCSLELIRARLAGKTSDRPLARDPERFEALFTQRQPAYSRADYRIGITNNDPSQTVARILKLPLF